MNVLWWILFIRLHTIKICYCMSCTRFNLTTRDSYFTTLVGVFTDHILAKNIFTNRIEWTEHKIMVLKPTNKYQIIRQCHNFKNILIGNLQHQPFLSIERKFCKRHFFTEPKTTYWKDKAINHSNIYLLCDLLWCYYSIS